MAIVEPGAKRSATIEALEDAETFCVLQTEFTRLRRTHPVVNELVIDFLASEVRLLNERLLEAMYAPVDTRLRRRLLELADIYAGERDEIVIPLTQEELAWFVGGTRATVNQALRVLEREGAIKLLRGKTVITDLDLLSRRAR
jgi:CRP/FNR family transcriptional regulator, cyclic AMP receptor protein